MKDERIVYTDINYDVYDENGKYELRDYFGRPLDFKIVENGENFDLLISGNTYQTFSRQSTFGKLINKKLRVEKLNNIDGNTYKYNLE